MPKQKPRRAVINQQENRGTEGTRKRGSILPDIPQDSLLGVMLKLWNKCETRRGKSKEKIIKNKEEHRNVFRIAS